MTDHPSHLRPVITTTATPADRIRRLQAEAKSLAADQLSALIGQLQDAAKLADDIAAGGEAYAVGVREVARRLGEDLAGQALVLVAIRERGR